MIIRTGTNTYTHTLFTQTEVVVNQFRMSLEYANVLNEERKELLLQAIKEIE